MAIKTSLRQFQQDLAQRLQSAKAQPAAATRLGVQCGDGYWLIDLADAGEIVPVPDILPVPLTKPFTKDSLLKTVGTHAGKPAN